MRVMNIYKSNKFRSLICRISQKPKNDRKIETVKFLFFLSIVTEKNFLKYFFSTFAFWFSVATNEKKVVKHIANMGWSGGAMVLGKLPVPGRPTYLDYGRVMAYCACSRCGWGLFGHFFSRLSFLFSHSLSLGDGPI